MSFPAAPDQPRSEAIRRDRIRATRAAAAPYYPTMAWRSRALLTAAAAAGLAVAAAGLAAAAPSWPGPPRGSAPQVAGAKTAPPPAWVETIQHSSWLAYSSYCWRSRPTGTAACVDFLPPRSRTDLPVVSAHTGSMLRFHLQFATSKLSVSYPDKRTQRLKSSRIASWLPLRSGIVTVSARSASGQEASYLFRLTLTPPISQATAAPGPLERGKWVCSPRSSQRACAGPVTIGVRYLYVLRTHCGILDTYFAGRLWRANPALTDGSGNPPRGWENPEALGTMRLVRAGLAEFRQDEKRVARFTPAPPHWKTVTCD